MCLSPRNILYNIWTVMYHIVLKSDTRWQLIKKTQGRMHSLAFFSLQRSMTWRGSWSATCPSQHCSIFVYHRTSFILQFLCTLFVQILTFWEFHTWILFLHDFQHSSLPLTPYVPLPQYVPLPTLFKVLDLFFNYCYIDFTYICTYIHTHIYA